MIVESWNTTELSARGFEGGASAAVGVRALRGTDVAGPPDLSKFDPALVATLERDHRDYAKRAERTGMFLRRGADGSDHMTITPAFAALILSRFAPKDDLPNRKMRQVRVIKLSHDIQRGRWESETHQGIAFTDRGILQDGQHRLAACLRSGVPIRLPVWYGQPRRANSKTDDVVPREASDILALGGTPIPSTVLTAAVARMVLAVRARDMPSARLITKADVVEFATSHHEALAPAVRIGMNASRHLRARVPGTPLGAAAFIISDVADVTSVQEFFGRLADGENLLGGSPILALREGLRAGVLSAGRLQSLDRSVAIYGAVINGWNRWRGGKRCRSQKDLLLQSLSDLPVPVA